MTSMRNDHLNKSMSNHIRLSLNKFNLEVVMWSYETYNLRNNNIINSYMSSNLKWIISIGTFESPSNINSWKFELWNQFKASHKSKALLSC